MIRYLLVISFSIFLVSCAALNEIQNGTPSGISYVSKHESDLISDLGEPNNIRRISSRRTVLYYPNRWYIVEDSRVSKGAYFSNNTYDISYKSFADKVEVEKLKGKTFSVFSGTQKISNNDIEFKINASALSCALKVTGLVPTNDPKPDYIFLLSYGISDPIVDVDVTYVPTFDWIPGQTTKVTGNYGKKEFSATSTTAGALVSTGYVPHVTKTTNFNRYLVVNGYKSSKTISESQNIWKVIMQSTGYVSDLQPVLGAMIGILHNQVLTSTVTKVKFSIPTNDPFTSWDTKSHECND